MIARGPKEGSSRTEESRTRPGGPNPLLAAPGPRLPAVKKEDGNLFGPGSPSGCIHVAHHKQSVTQCSVTGRKWTAPPHTAQAVSTHTLVGET